MLMNHLVFLQSLSRNVHSAFVVVAWVWGSSVALSASPSLIDASTSRHLNTSDGRDWPAYGRTFGQQHYSPLAEINRNSISRMGLAWWLDLGPQNSATQPIAVDGVLYFATGLSVVQAVDAVSGKRLWSYDPGAAERAGLNLRHGWGVRGIASWNGKIYTGTVDGRLIAIDLKSGEPVWSVQTFDKDDAAHINGAPRVFDGKVVIGFAGSTGASRGYVTAYDAETGKRLWRFYTVPRNPANGFESRAMDAAAKTWAGEWWKKGGGGADVWNAIAYDVETDTVFIGTGSGFAQNRKIRSEDSGDNLFVSSIVALDGATGAYRWHYQTTPGDTWDFDATMDIVLADLVIAGEVRKVLMQAPKNGFLYVIDRVTGQLISAEAYAKVTWASHVDMRTGRPVERPVVRYPSGIDVEIWPSSIGAHNWMPMAYSPKSQLVYIPKIEFGVRYTDRGIELQNWQPATDRAEDFGFGGSSVVKDPTGALLAWNPVTQTAAWSIPQPTMFNGGILATGGDLVFQGTIDGAFKAHSAATGKVLWSFAAQAPLIATPITYSVDGQQYLTLLTGLGMGLMQGAGGSGRDEKYQLDSRSQRRRVLTFKLGGKAELPAARYLPLPPVADLEFQSDMASEGPGRAIYDRHCGRCHGPAAIAVIQAPDLRRSGIILSAEAFRHIVRDGGLVPNGMPGFGELTDEQLNNLRRYLRTEAHALRNRNRCATNTE